MVSRLAWLLRSLDAEPLEWTTESPDPALLGTLAHGVFEGLFRPGVPLPEREEIAQRVEQLLEDTLQRRAPFLRSSQWSVERRHFAAQTTTAAIAWRDALAQLGAQVLGSEQWLQGRWSGIAVHGQTDLILGLPGDRLLVVDYKRSKSARRLAQMQKGFDSQASLYRAMLQTGGPKTQENATLIARVRAAAQTGVVYYMLNDQVALTDSALPGTAAVPGWRTLPNDIAGQAMALIGQRLAQVRAGELHLNREGDAEFFDKRAGINPYALEVSPLIGLFTLPADPEPPR
jgi:RecB family exonuclease